MGGKGKAPPPVDPGKAQGEFLFGEDFGSAAGVTDPRLQDRLISAERTYRPEYTALELADINTMAVGIEAGRPNPEYQRLEAELASLRAAPDQQSTSTSTSEEYTEDDFLRALILGKSPDTGTSGTVLSSEDREARIAQIEEQMQGMDQTLGKTKGLFDLLEDQSRRAGELQREQLGLQREADVGALKDFAPQVVEAYRDADPYSTEIAERMSRKAMGQLTPEEQRGIDQRARQGSLARGRIGDSSSLAAEALGRSDYTAQFAQPAFGMNRQLAGDVGMTLLGRPSSAIGLGNQMLGQATAGAAGSPGPQLFDANAGINLALQQRGQDMELMGANAQARGAMIGGIAGGLGTAYGN